MKRRETFGLAAGFAISALGVGRSSAARDTADDEVLAGIMARLAATGRTYLPSGTYKLSKPLVIPPGVLEGGRVTLDFRDADPANFPDRICVLVKGAPKTRLPDLSGNLTIGADLFRFKAPHGLSAGDAFQLSGTVDFAGNGYRHYYRKGEIFRVEHVVDATTVRVAAGCRDTYRAAEVEVWKRAGDRFTQACTSLTILGRDDIKLSLRLAALDRTVIDNVRVERGKHSALSFTDCFGITGENIVARQFSDAHEGYGILVGNSQDVRLRGDVYGYFNGIAVGGGLTKGGKIGMNRDIHFEGTGASDPVGGLSGANFHGNTEYSSYRGTFRNGVTLAGNKNEAHDEFIGGSGRSVIRFGEMHGHEFRVSGVARTNGADLKIQHGAIHQPDYGMHARYGGRTVLDLQLHVAQATRIIWWRPQKLSRADAVLELRLDIVEAHPTTRFMALRRQGLKGRAFPSVELRQFVLRDDRVPIRWWVDKDTRLGGSAAANALSAKRAIISRAQAYK